MTNTSTNATQAVRQFIKICLKLKPVVLITFLNSKGREGFDEALPLDPITQDNCLPYDTIRNDASGQIAGKMYFDAVISEGEESGEDDDLDFGFGDSEDSSSDDDCCVVSVFDADVGACEQEPHSAPATPVFGVQFGCFSLGNSRL